MKLVSQILLLIAVVFGLATCKKNTNDIVYNKKYVEQIKAARKEIVFYLSTNRIPGAGIAVMKDGQLIYSEALGLASTDLEVPATRETKFRIGDVSEIFTSFIYLRMVEEGLLHPDSSVQHYLPYFPEKADKISLNDLVYQMSGLRDPNMEEVDWLGLNITLQKGLEQFKNDPLTTIPGLYQTPSMYHYNLLGAVMEKATNKRFNQIFKEYVTDTLQLTRTVVDNPFITIKERSNFFDRNFISQMVNATTRDLRYRAPAQGILSNAEDLVKLGDAILHSNLLSAETKAKMFEPIPLLDSIPSTVSNAWVILSDLYGQPIYGKVGKVTGGSAAILMYPNLNLVVACVTNLNTGIEEPPVFELAQPFVPEQNEEDTPNEELGVNYCSGNSMANRFISNSGYYLLYW